MKIYISLIFFLIGNSALAANYQCKEDFGNDTVTIDISPDLQSIELGYQDSVRDPSDRSTENTEMDRLLKSELKPKTQIQFYGIGGEFAYDLFFNQKTLQKLPASLKMHLRTLFVEVGTETNIYFNCIKNHLNE